jgi:ribosomal protein S18 acetylase RimI-like enzyme
MKVTLDLDLNYNEYTENINEKYIENIKNDKKNRIIIHCIDTHYIDNNSLNTNSINKLSNITSFLIYRKVTLSTTINIYILLIGVHLELRKIGYGKILLDEFIESLKKMKTKKNINIILRSLDTSENFFINYGFKNLEKSKFLKEFEGWGNNKPKLYILNIK